MPEALFQPAHYPAAQVLSGAWRILRTHFWSLCLGLLVTGLTALAGAIVLGILMIKAPSLHPLLMVLENLWINVLVIGFLRVIALRSAGHDADIFASLGSLGQREAWSLALIPAILGVLLLQISGYPAGPVHPGDTAAALRVLEEPRLWVVLLLSFIVSIYFQYVFALYAAYGDSPPNALRNALRVFTDRLPWLFFPFLVALVASLVGFTTIFVLALLVGLLFGAGAAHDPALAMPFVLLLFLLFFPIFVWTYSCAVLAAANLKRGQADASFLP